MTEGASFPAAAAAAAAGSMTFSLVTAGTFTEAGGIPANNIARWDGTEWYSMGQGLLGEFFTQVFDLVVFDGDLIAGGWFNQAGGQPAGNLARWDGANWYDMGNWLVGVDLIRVGLVFGL